MGIKKELVEKQKMEALEIKKKDQKLLDQKPKSNFLKDNYYIAFIICFAGIVGCYTFYGILQESLLADKSKKINTFFIMGTQFSFASLISFTIIKMFGMGSVRENCSTNDIIISALCIGSTYCSNQALKYVNYPFMALTKSSKILSVIMVGWAMGT